MRCPFCRNQNDKVVNSRSCQDGQAIRRRRECLGCGERYTTYEFVERGSVTVLKSDNRRERFDRTKILHGIQLACNKRPVSRQEMDAIVDAIEADIHARGKPEITSMEVGEMVVRKLREIDEVAFVRFASVYRKFQDKEEFFAELKRLMDKK